MSLDAGSAVAYLTLDRSNYSLGIKSAAQELMTFMDNANSASTRMNALGNSMVSVGGTLTKGVTLPILGVGTAITAMSANFEEGMSEVQAISGATGEDLQKLTDTAKELGSKTKYSATEAAQGMANLASAGFDVNQIISAMPGMLDLAASGNIDLASAADIASSTLRGFGLEASEAAHVADVLAKAAADTNAGITDTGEAMKYIAPVASAMGFSLEEVAAAIGEMANAGIKGGQAGTTLRSALTRLANPSKEASDLMKELSFSSYDASDNMLPLKGIISNLNSSLEGLTEGQKQQAIATIFGQEAMSGMLTLIQAGPEELEKLTDSFVNSDGAAKNMAETMQNNLKGAITKIKSALEGAAISLGDTLLPMLDGLADKIQSAVDWFNNLDDATKESIVKYGLYVAAAGPAILVTGKLINTGVTAVSAIGSLARGVGVLTKSVTGLGSVSTVAAKGGIAKVGAGIISLGPAGVAAGIGIAAVGAAMYAAHENADMLNGSVLKSTDEMSGMEVALGKLSDATMYSKEEMIKLGYVYDDWNSKVSTKTRDTLEMVAEKSRNIQLAIDSVNFDGIIDDNDIATVKSKTEDWCNSIVEVIESNKSEVNTAIENLFGADGVVSEAEQQVLNILNASNDEKVKIVQESNDKINEITQKAHEENRKLNSEELSLINEETKKANNALLDSMIISDEEKLAAKNLFFQKASAYSAKALSESLVKEKAIIEESKNAIRDKYDEGIRAFEAMIPTLTGMEKQLAEEQLQVSINQRDLLLQNENDKWADIVGACEEGYGNYMGKINKYTGEELSKEDIKNQQLFNKTAQHYESINTITEDGMYKLRNTSTGEWENIVVKTDEATGEIVAMAKIVSDQYGTRTTEVVGYTDEYKRALKGEADQAFFTRNAIREALNDQSKITADWKNKTLMYNNDVIAKFTEVKNGIHGTKTGIIDLNGTPLEVTINKDGTIKDIDKILEKLSLIQDKNINITTNYMYSSHNKSSQYATGTYSAMNGMALVGESGPEFVNFDGGERVYNAMESKRIVNNMYNENTSSKSYDDGINEVTNLLNEVANKLNEAINTESTFEMVNQVNLSSTKVGEVVTPIVSNKLAIAGISKKRR